MGFSCVAVAFALLLGELCTLLLYIFYLVPLGCCKTRPYVVGFMGHLTLETLHYFWFLDEEWVDTCSVGRKSLKQRYYLLHATRTASFREQESFLFFWTGKISNRSNLPPSASIKDFVKINRRQPLSSSMSGRIIPNCTQCQAKSRRIDWWSCFLYAGIFRHSIWPNFPCNWVVKASSPSHPTFDLPHSLNSSDYDSLLSIFASNRGLSTTLLFL